MHKLNTKLPDSPGVYFFKRGKEILYIGKATSLKDRVRSYFNLQTVLARGPIIGKMLELTTAISFRKTDSVLEAVILEAELIKKHQPKFNSREKDNKSFLHVVITDEAFPRVLQVRGRALSARPKDFEIKKVFGPFPSAAELKEVMIIIRKIFPFRDKCAPNTGKPCFNFQIGLCSGVCVGEISSKDYKKQIKNIEIFLSGKKRAVATSLKREMRELAKNQEFEKAGEIKRKIFVLDHIQDVSLLKREVHPASTWTRSVQVRIEAYDVAHQSGGNNVGVMVVVERGEPSRGEYRKFKIRGRSGADDLRSLKEVLERRLNHPEWRLPDILVVDGGKLQMAVAKDVLARDGLTIPIVGVVKDQHHRPKNILGDANLIKKYERAILLANGEAHNFAITYFRKLAGKIR